MKLRTDFVTNSSSSSFIAFSIKSKEFIKSLEDIGFRFELKTNDTITESDKIITLNGKEIEPGFDIYTEEFYLQEFDPDKTIFEWFLKMFDGQDAFIESCVDAEDAAEKIKAIEKSIKKCEIKGGVAITDGDGSFCMHITVRNGKKKTATLSEENWNGEIGLGCEIELEYDGNYAKVADKYGQVQISDL